MNVKLLTLPTVTEQLVYTYTNKIKLYIYNIYNIIYITKTHTHTHLRNISISRNVIQHQKVNLLVQQVTGH